MPMYLLKKRNTLGGIGGLCGRAAAFLQLNSRDSHFVIARHSTDAGTKRAIESKKKSSNIRNLFRTLQKSNKSGRIFDSLRNFFLIRSCQGANLGTFRIMPITAFT
jgi:hypothetical protein